MRRTSAVIALALMVALVGCAPKKPAGTKVVARVGGRAITAADLDARLEDIPQLARPEYSGPVGRSRMLRQMVEEEVLYRAALDDHLDRDRDVRRKIEQSTRQLLVQSYLDRQQARMSHVDEKELRNFYDKHKDEYRTERMVKVRILVAPSQKIAQRVREMVTEGQSFEALCKKFSSDPHIKDAGGMLPTWVRRGKAVPWLGNHPAFHDVVFALKKDELSQVFETPKGFHVARVEDVRDEQLRTFEQARNDIELRLKRERTSKGLPEIVEDLKRRYHVKIEEDAGKSPEELWAAAQQAADPTSRVGLYLELVERYPKDPHVVEALFMIGFTKSEELHDRAGAEAAFRRVIEEFPESELAQSARWMLTSEGNAGPDFEGAPVESAGAGGASP